MKKILALTLALTVVFALYASALAEKDAERDRWLYEKSLEYAVMVGKLARSDGYIRSMLNEPTESMQDILEEIRLQDYSQPTSMRIYGFRDSLISLMMINELGLGLDEVVYEMGRRCMYSAAPMTFLEASGSDTMVLCNALNYSTVCLLPETLTESVMVILEYEGNWSIAVTYISYPEKTAYVSAILIPAFDAPLTNPFITTPEIYQEDALIALSLSEPPLSETEKPDANNETALVYYNPNGGKYYHADPCCPRVDPTYWPLSPVSLEKINNDKGYSRLLPCSACGAPERTRTDGAKAK